MEAAQVFSWLPFAYGVDLYVGRGSDVGARHCYGAAIVARGSVGSGHSPSASRSLCPQMGGHRSLWRVAHRDSVKSMNATQSCLLLQHRNDFGRRRVFGQKGGRAAGQH